MRASPVYARFSTEKENADSTVDQVARCREFAMRGFMALGLLLPVPSAAAGSSECEILVALRVRVDQSGIAQSSARSALSRLGNVKLVDVDAEEAEWLFELSVAALELREPLGTVGYAISTVAGMRLHKFMQSEEALRVWRASKAPPQWILVMSAALPAGENQVREVVEIAVAHFDDHVLKIPRGACADSEREERRHREENPR